MTDQALTVPTQVPTLPTPVGCHDYAAQREWEHWQVRRGIERYRASLVKFGEDGAIKRKALVDLEPGQVIAQDLIGPMVEAVRGYQTRAAQEIVEFSRPSDAAWALTLLPAETLAAVTVLHALSHSEPRSFTAAAVSLGGRVQDEVDMDRWRQRERDAVKEAVKAGHEPPTVLFKLMKDRNKVVDRRVFKKWAKKAPLFSSGDWAPAVRVHVGTTLLHLLVESNAWFEVVVERVGPRERRIFRMTDAGLAWVSHRHHQNELMRPYLLPMICEPRDHEYLPDEGASVSPQVA